MDSVSHTKVARILLGYVEDSCGVQFDHAAFVYGNLKPDLKGEYFKKRHYPSVMLEEVIERIKTFAAKYQIGFENGRELSVELGVICHYMTDFFCYPHNDDIYNRNLLAHYIYEKRISLRLGKKIDEEKFMQWVNPITPPVTLDALIKSIRDMHNEYIKQTDKHCIKNDLICISRILALVVMSMIKITFQSVDALKIMKLPA